MTKAILITLMLWNIGYSVAQVGVGVLQIAIFQDTTYANKAWLEIQKDSSMGKESLIIELETAESLYNAYIPPTYLEQWINIYIPCVSNKGGTWSILDRDKDTLKILPRRPGLGDLIFKSWEVFLLQCDSVMRTDPLTNPVVGKPDPKGPLIPSLDSLTYFKVYDVFEQDGSWWLCIYQGEIGEHVWGFYKDNYMIYDGKKYEVPNGFYNAFIQWRNDEKLLIVPKPNFTTTY
jgi:hypothetical protein